MGHIFWHFLLFGVVVTASVGIGKGLDGQMGQSTPETTSEEPVDKAKLETYVQGFDDKGCDRDCAIIITLVFSYIAVVFAMLWAITACAARFRNLDSLIDCYFKEVGEHHHQEMFASKIQPQLYV
ncbi:unnamed protein product [Caenorhabditis brenneri]